VDASRLAHLRGARRRDGRGEGRPAGPGGLRAERDGALPARVGRELPDPTEGARRRLPARPPAPLAPLVAAAGGAARASGGRAVDPRLLLPAGLRADRHADPHRLDRGARGDALRDRLLRRARVPGADGAALRRGGVPRVPARLLLRPDVPCGEVEDAAPPDRVLDGRAGGRVRGLERQHAAAGGARLVPGRARAGAVR
jgi:hypothetical protein